jgi:predicted extracellular nuclease
MVSIRRRLAAGAAALILLAAAAPRNDSHTVLAASSGLVISQVYGGGGNASAPFTHDFIEIYNGGAMPISLAGLSLQYASATGTGNFGSSATVRTELPAINVAPGGYFLVQEASQAAVGSPLPAPDHIDSDGPIQMSGTAGKVALVTGIDSLGCNGGSNPCSADALARIIDLVGYGSANFSETAAAPAPSNTTAIIRIDGNVDTDNNRDDFAVANPPTPRNGGVLQPNPTLSISDASVSEGAGTMTFTVTLSRASATDVSYSLETRAGTATSDVDYVALFLSGQFIPAGQLSATHAVAILDDAEDEQPNETFDVVLSSLVNVDPGDLAGTGTITNDDVAFRAIHELQGEDAVSPFANRDVLTRGIVTARKTNGFFIQTPDGGGDDRPETSEALFVFTGTVPAQSLVVGDDVRVSGRLVEFRASGAALPGTLTEITGPAMEHVASSQPLPAAIDLASLLPPPGSIVYRSREEQFERYEGMLVAAPSMDVVAPTNGFGELYAVVSGVPRPFREPGVDIGEALPAKAPPAVPRFDGNFERVMLDSDDARFTVTEENAVAERFPLNLPAGAPGSPVRIASVAGPIDYAFDSYRVVLGVSAVASGDRQPVPVPAAAGAEFTIASLNLENFRDGTANFAARQEKAARLIVEVLRTPDILGTIEVGDLEDLQQLAALVNAAAGTAYDAYLEDGDGQPTGFEQNIGYLVNHARINVMATEQVYAGKTFEFGGSTDLLHDRPPLVLEAQVIHTGTPVTVILNHLRSLIDVNNHEPFGASGFTVGERVREKRRLQAEDLADLIAERITENLVVMGDMNAFEFNDGLVDVVGTLKGSPAPADKVVASSFDRWDYELADLADALPANDRYSYVFEGTAQVLDHMLVNQLMRQRLTRFTYSRNNADFPEAFESDFTVTTRLSDHDAAVAYFGPLANLAVAAAAASTVEAGATVGIQATASNDGETAADVALSMMLPAGLAWQSTTAPSGWTCTTAGDTVTCTTGSLAAGAQVTLEIAALAGCAVPNGSALAVPVAIESSAVESDPSDNLATGSTTVSNSAPVVADASVSRPTLLVPLHQMVPIAVRYNAADACGAVTSALSVRSDEPVTGHGQGVAGLTTPDWRVIDAHRVLLRAERSVRGDGRTYTITITATDEAGGKSTRQVTVAVPRRR